MKKIVVLTGADETQTENSKFDVVYSDNKINILVPINFTASRETAKNTDWCSQSYSGYSFWNKISIMFRIIPNDKNLDKLKLTWRKGGDSWYIACSKYPEIQGKGSPFDEPGGVENWKIIKNKNDEYYKSVNSGENRWNENSDKIEKTMSLLSNDAKEYIEKYYYEHGKN